MPQSLTKKRGGLTFHKFAMNYQIPTLTLYGISVREILSSSISTENKKYQRGGSEHSTRMKENAFSHLLLTGYAVLFCKLVAKLSFPCVWTFLNGILPWSYNTITEALHYILPDLANFPALLSVRFIDWVLALILKGFQESNADLLNPAGCKVLRLNIQV